jgi:hypothetical protein
MHKDCYYLAPGGTEFTAFVSTSPPPVAEGCTRVVCISDTHNEHSSLVLPWGHLLVGSSPFLSPARCTLETL